MNQADSQQATDPAQAAATWAAVDQAVTLDAPWVTLANLNNVDFLSARVTNCQYNPFLGVLLDQLQIRPAPSPADSCAATISPRKVTVKCARWEGPRTCPVQAEIRNGLGTLPA
jgi:hypothetical protein